MPHVLILVPILQHETKLQSMWHTLEAMHSLERSWPGKESLLSSMPCMDKVCLSASHVCKQAFLWTVSKWLHIKQLALVRAVMHTSPR